MCSGTKINRLQSLLNQAHVHNVQYCLEANCKDLKSLNENN